MSTTTPLTRRIVLVCIAITLTGGAVTSCSKSDHDHSEEYIEGGPAAGEHTGPLMPYNAKWEHLTDQPPEKVATEVVRTLAELPASTTAEQTADTLNGVVTTECWNTITDNPQQIIPTITGPNYRQWADAGGEQTATVTISDEQHPPDTDTTWARKVGTVRQLEGTKLEAHDTWLVSLEKPSDQWRVSTIQVIETNYATARGKEDTQHG